MHKVITNIKEKNLSALCGLVVLAEEAKLKCPSSEMHQDAEVM